MNQSTSSSNPLSKNLLRFSVLGLGYDKINAGEHANILALMEKAFEDFLVRRSQNKKGQDVVLILLPRGSYKTTIASTAFPIWALQQNPDLRICVDSETYSLAKTILGAVKQQYDNPASHYVSNFPEKAVSRNSRDLVRWTEDSIITPGRTPDGTKLKEGSISAVGIDGVKAGMHYDIIIADDLHSQNNTRSQRQIDEVVEHYRLLMPILEPDGLFIIIGTRWAEEDAYTNISKDAKYQLFIPALSDTPMNSASLLVDPSLTITNEEERARASEQKRLIYCTSTDSCAEWSKLAPYYENFPRTLPTSLLEKHEERMGTFVYSAQYLLKPMASKDRRFRDEWMQYYVVTPDAPLHDFPPLAPPDLSLPQFRRLGFVDPAFTTSEYSDPTGIVIVAVDHQRNMYVKHASEYKLEPFQLVDTLFQLSEKHKVDEWFIEEVAAQKILRFFLEYVNKHEKKNLVFSPVKSLGRKKELRIMSLQPYFERKKFFFSQDQTTLLHQIKNFPILKHDDVIDALAYVPQVVYDGAYSQPIKVKPEGTTFEDAWKSTQAKKPEGIRPLRWSEHG